MAKGAMENRARALLLDPTRARARPHYLPPPRPPAPQTVPQPPQPPQPRRASPSPKAREDYLSEQVSQLGFKLGTLEVAIQKAHVTTSALRDDVERAARAAGGNLETRVQGIEGSLASTRQSVEEASRAQSTEATELRQQLGRLAAELESLRAELAQVQKRLEA